MLLIMVKTIFSFGQEINWSASPRKGFVFQISNREAQSLLSRSSPDSIIHSLLHTQVDTFDTRTGWVNRPEKGHFILASIVENKLQCEYTSVFPYQVFLLREYNSLALQVLDLEGNVREDAIVKIKRRRIPVDRESKSYRLANAWFMGTERIVTVEWAGFRSVFNVTRNEAPTWDNDWPYRDGPDFYSYMITDKNRYKPGETIRYKSFALTGSRNLMRKPLELWLLGTTRPKKVGSIDPHRPGSYAGEIFLHDSLRLMLDRGFTLQLREKKGRIVSTCSFRYEDYELNGDHMEIRLADQNQFHPAGNELTISATDINGLRLKDAKATVTVRLTSLRETFQTVVILPDTLLRVNIDLDPDEDTRMTIPSYLFDKANGSYEVAVELRNMNNRVVTKTVGASHYYSKTEIRSRFSNDSIVYECVRNGIVIDGVPFVIKSGNAENGRRVLLPYKERINPVISSVTLTGDTLSREISMSTMVPKLELQGGIKKDSVVFRLHNPQQLDIAWFVYQGQELIRKGFGKHLKFDTLVFDRSRSYYVELVYSFGGEDHLIRRGYPFRDDHLNVSLELPDRVYPGQKAEALIQVTDGLGSPVENVDLTAVGVNGQLDYYLPDLPYYGETSELRPQKATYTKQDLNKRFAKLDLDYRKWKGRAGLDTMKYYQFTYPTAGSFEHSLPIADSTQMAPFVMQKGLALVIYAIEINRVPVYFSWVDKPDQYTVYVPPNQKISLSLRLHDRVLLFDSLSFPRNHKTILSVDLDNLPPGVRTYKVSTTTYPKRKPVQKFEFSSIERDRYRPYVSSFRFHYGTSNLEGVGGFIPLFRDGEFSQRSIVVGPVPNGMQTFVVSPGNLAITYRHEGGYAYAFEGNVVYKLSEYNLLPEKLSKATFQPMTVVNDLVMTKARHLEPYYKPGKYHTRSVSLADGSIQMSVRLPREEAESGLAGILFRDCASGKITTPCRSGAGQSDLTNVPRGCQAVFVMCNNGSYFSKDSVMVRSHTRVVIDFNNSALSPPDSNSAHLLEKVSADCYMPVVRREVRMRRSQPLQGNIRGVVFAAEDGSPLPGVNVVVKGTTNGTVTDVDGRFALHSEDYNVTLMFSFIGFAIEEVDAQVGAEMTVSMTADVQQLTEVIVTGQGFSRESRALGYSVSGRVAGVAIDEEPGEVGEAAKEEFQDKDADQRLYSELLQIQSIRSHFSDVAFWEPRLFTDKRGQSKFSLKFPDDITRWEATVYAMNRQLQTGTGRKAIKSYKPIVSELNVPNFLTRGDSAMFRGNVLNYSADSLLVGTVTWTIGPKEESRSIRFRGSHTEMFPVRATGLDTIVSSYRFVREDGYLDGEQRKVPVTEQGIVRAEGTLTFLNDQKEIKVKSMANESMTLQLMANSIDVFAGEAKFLMSYPYDCNEQLASKLAGLLNYRLIMKFEEKPFRSDREVQRIITRLLRNQNQEFLWSWWDVSPNTSYWVSSHVIRVLRAAADAGYPVDLDVENLARKVEFRYLLRKQYSRSDADLLNALSAWDVKLDYALHIRNVEALLRNEAKAEQIKKVTRTSNLVETLLLQEVRLRQNLDYRRDSLLKYKRETIKGGIYFADGLQPSSWYADELSVNAVAYRLVRVDTALKDLVAPIQLYFLGERGRRNWNTYHSSNVVMPVMMDLVAGGATKANQSTVRITGKVDTTVSRYPYTMELLPGEEANVQKISGTPLYFMKYIKERVTHKKVGVPGFEIATKLGGDTGVLEAGKPVTLSVEVTVTKDAEREYVMLEIPIPGACSYANKRKYESPVETHRQHFKDRVVVFCERMKPGTYTFSVDLLPRFTGRFVVNPAQVSLMYFPVVNANTDMKRVQVR